MIFSNKHLAYTKDTFYVIDAIDPFPIFKNDEANDLPVYQRHIQVYTDGNQKIADLTCDQKKEIYLQSHADEKFDDAWIKKITESDWIIVHDEDDLEISDLSDSVYFFIPIKLTMSDDGYTSLNDFQIGD